MPKWPRNKEVRIHPEDAARVRELAGQGCYPSEIALQMPHLTVGQIKYQTYKAKAPETAATVSEAMQSENA